jgi:predicted regulator of Ras-like GTPase activity (Roadblock/LC7/MglB family)
MAHGFRNITAPKKTNPKPDKKNPAVQVVADVVVPVDVTTQPVQSVQPVPATQPAVNDTAAAGLFAMQPGKEKVMSRLEVLLQQLRLELGADFISTDVLGKDGISIAGGSIDRRFESAHASSQVAMMMGLAARVTAKISLGKVEENLVTTDQAIIISRAIGDGSFYWYVAIARAANLGSVRISMKEYAPQIWDVIPR